MGSNGTNETVIDGWVTSNPQRGSIDILWSCCITIVLCCWVSVIPNVGSPKDKWYHKIWDRVNLACIALLGPDLIFGIAWGQFSSARRSVKLFKEDKRLKIDTKWSMTHAFFVDMGGIHLKSPDFPQGFPINAEQFHYLISNDHIDFPDMEKLDIRERNAADTLSRVITIFQAFWFTVSEIQRTNMGLPMTTLELTAVSFSMMMLATSITWYYKPYISEPRFIWTKHEKSVEAIREYAKQYTHPWLPSKWYGTPLEFIGRRRFAIDAHWVYYTRVAELIHLPLYSRPVTTRPWDRFRSDMWLCPDFTYTPIASVVLLGFSVLFIVAWHFHFPTHAEQIMWRTCSVYHAFFSIYGGIYFLVEMIRTKRQFERRYRQGEPNEIESEDLEQDQGQSQEHDCVMMHDYDDAEAEVPLHPIVSTSLAESSSPEGQPRVSKARMVVNRVRNISREQDPDMAVPLRVIVPVSLICALYICCRLFIYVEDFMSLRAQPAGVYISVNQFIPFLGS